MISVFDLFRIGVGPSSSHTVGPMKAARLFAEGLFADGLAHGVASVHVELFGSLGATGRGHGSDRAVILGLLGETPEGVDPDRIDTLVGAVRAAGRLPLLGRHETAWDEAAQLRFLRQSLPRHPNALRFTATGSDGQGVRTRVYYSVGGGFVVDEGAAGRAATEAGREPPFPFRTGADLLRLCAESGVRISDLMLANEKALRPEPEVRAGLLRLWDAMQECVRRGCEAEGVLPGGLKVRRRAADLRRGLLAHPEAAAAWSPHRPTAPPASSPPCCTTTRASCRRRATTASRASC
jgi:L-serine dehydratase